MKGKERTHKDNVLEYVQNELDLMLECDKISVGIGTTSDNIIVAISKGGLNFAFGIEYNNDSEFMRSTAFRKSIENWDTLIVKSGVVLNPPENDNDNYDGDKDNYEDDPFIW